MRKFYRFMYCVVMAALVFSLSGCGGSSGGGNDNSSSTSTGDKLMVVSSPVLQKGGSYRLYRGNKVSVRASDENYNPTYYVAPISGTDSVTMNLEFANSISEDQPFLITQEDSDGKEDVVFYYNPKGNGQTDLTTAYGEVLMWGGSTQQLSYSGLTLSAASLRASAIDLDTSDEIVIVLDGDTATVDGSAVPFYNYVWHADPDHRDEYYTLDIDGTTELTEAAMLANISPLKGVYINRDIRYMPNTLSFIGTAKNDDETEFVAYYSDAVQAEVAAELGDGFEGPYIFATLPNSAGHGMPGGPGGMGGQPGEMRMPGQDMGTPPSMRGAVSNSDIAAFSTMTHSAQDAYNNPVLHITEAGTYRLKGTWNGQIWIEVGKEVADQVALILDNITVTCTVAPALVFREVYECGPTDKSLVSFDVADNLFSKSGLNAGAALVIADGSTNNFTGANVYRMLKAQKKKDSVTTIDGSDVSQQKKRYKMDGALYSFMSMVIAAENNNSSGTLNVTSTTYEGLDTEMHLLLDSGTVNVTAQDDGINVNEDNVSVFTMNGGKLTVTTPGGDGIDSNGYIVINDGILDITCANDSDQLNAQAEGPLDADCGVYMSDSVTYTHRAYSGDTNTQPNTEGQEQPSTPQSGTETTTTTKTKTPISVTDSNGNVVMSITYSNPVTDTDTSSRGIDNTGDVFTLTHTVNNFSGIKFSSAE